MDIERIPTYPTHAAHITDNSDGEGHQYYVLAYEQDGQLYDHDNGRPLIEYEGDEIIRSWPLN